MTDIVWLLRNDVPCNGDIDCAGELCNQAAEEIERLRKDLSLAVFADNEYWQVLEKENERLRAALREIVILDDEPQCCGRGIAGYDNPPECCGDPERGIDRAQSIARAALEVK